MKFEQETIRVFYKKILALYPPAFRQRFGESMEQTFGDLCNERNGQTSFGFLLWTFGETFAGVVKEHLTQIKRGATMENLISNGKSAALIGFLLAMPFALLLFIEVSGVEPLHGFLMALTTEGGSAPRLSNFGKIFMLGTLLLLPLGFIISLAPVVRNARAGFGLTASPVNILISAVLFIFIAALITGFVVDQYPCWIGVPNCD